MLRLSLPGAIALLLVASEVEAAPSGDIAARVAAVEARVIETRRDIHAHPELGNREQRTAALVAKRLRGLGLEVRARRRRTPASSACCAAAGRAGRGAARGHGRAAGYGGDRPALRLEGAQPPTRGARSA